LDQKTIYEIIQKYKENTATDAERQALLEWYRNMAYRDAEFPEDEASVETFMLQRLQTSIGAQKGVGRVRRMGRRNWYIAASVILLLGIGVAVILRKPRQPEASVAAVQPVHDIGPGTNVAKLTLANGSVVSLTDAVKGDIAEQSGIRISKSVEGKIVYEVGAAGGSSDVAGVVSYNKIETPPAGQYQVVLPDGTRVWLNSSSYLRFPVHFSSDERRVELSGEAYFEIAANAKMPFYVGTNGMTVAVLGTSFNVHAYPDEKHIRTTLLEGAVRVAAEGSSVLLKPHDQADLGDRLHVSQVDVEDAVAWKNGFFRYHDERLETIMKHVSRWYNVSVVFDDEKLKDETFGVLSTRFANISALLHLLEQTADGVRFTLSGSVIVVSRKK